MAATVSGLADTGAILALLDRDDRWHRACVDAFPSLRLPLGTSGAVLAELFHLIRPHELTATWDFLRSGAIEVLPIAQLDMAPIEDLMERYRDRPMDFADASLVHLAHRESLKTVFTIDETYRTADCGHFRIVPPRLTA